MPTMARERGFTLVEVLASITAFTIVFLAGFGGIGKLLLTQDQNYARTVAASAAMIMADWHANTAIGTTAATGLLDNVSDPADTTASDTTHLLVKIPTANVASIKFHGYDNPGSANDGFFLFNSQPSAPRSLDLRNPSSNPYTPSDYLCLLVCISGASSMEADSHLTFREVSFWYGPPEVLKTLRSSAQTITLELVGRFTLPDKIMP